MRKILVSVSILGVLAIVSVMALGRQKGLPVAPVVSDGHQAVANSSHRLAWLRVESIDGGIFKMGILLPEGMTGLVDVDNAATSVDCFTDDKGANLGTHAIGISNFNGRSVLDVMSKPPTPGATSITFKAKVAVNVIARQRHCREKIDLKAGARIAGGLFDLTVVNVETSSGLRENRKLVTFCFDNSQTSGSLSVFGKKIINRKFVDQRGQEIDAEQRSWWTTLLGDSDKVRKDKVVYSFPSKVNSVFVDFDYIEKTEPQIIPVDLSVGVGI